MLKKNCLCPSIIKPHAAASPIYSVSRTIVAPSLYIWPLQISQLYGCDCVTNTVDFLTLQILSTKTSNLQILAYLTDKYALASIFVSWICSASPICNVCVKSTGTFIAAGPVTGDRWLVTSARWQMTHDNIRASWEIQCPAYAVFVRGVLTE